MDKLGNVGTVYYVLLTLSLTSCYFFLRRTVKKTIIIVEEARKIMKSIRLMFGFFVLSYALRTIVLIIQGQTYKIVKSKFARQELEIILWSLFDLLSILPVLIIHNKNFSLKKVSLNET